ncbi:MAG: M57 family metalloprotease [Candidatus Peribacteria bacterium]|nr:M57 family metalloprotease [Candidatus Peribacteria bacterium]
MFFIASIGLMSSCSQEDVVSNSEINVESEDALFSNQRYLDYLGQVMGFKQDKIQFLDSIILVEGDISFSKQNLQNDIESWNNHPNSMLRASYRTPYKVTTTSSIPVNINGIKVNGNAVSNWRTAVTSAIAEWNALSGDISFYIVDVPMSPTNSINFFIGAVSSNSNDAESSFPTAAGTPGPNIIINQNTYNNSKWTTATRRILMTHEIGHAIGLAHSDTSESGMTYISTSCGTNNDANSIMHHSLSSSNYITSCDTQAFNYLY